MGSQSRNYINCMFAQLGIIKYDQISQSSYLLKTEIRLDLRFIELWSSLWSENRRIYIIYNVYAIQYIFCIKKVG